MAWLEWNEISKLPDADGKYLVNKRNDWKKGNEVKTSYEVKILCFNEFHQCWDGEDGDDYECDIKQVTHWMPLPVAPQID